jgi:hypothetical protein
MVVEAVWKRLSYEQERLADRRPLFDGRVRLRSLLERERLADERSPSPLNSVTKCRLSDVTQLSG